MSFQNLHPSTKHEPVEEKTAIMASTHISASFLSESKWQKEVQILKIYVLVGKTSSNLFGKILL